MPEETVEQLLRGFEQITKKLERDEGTLEQSLALYARGLEINLKVRALLDSAERRVVEIIEPDGTIKPFEIQAKR